MKIPLSERVFKIASLLAVLLPISILVILFVDVIVDSANRLNWQFIFGHSSRKPELAGILPAIFGSFFLIGLSMLIAFPIGVSGAIYLEEYKKDNWFSRLIEINISNLAGIPSVIYGLIGLEIFVRFFMMDRSILSGACTMALLILPIIIMSTRESLRFVPHSIKEGAYALGGTRWQVTRRVILPTAMPTILTGVILAVSRALGETAPMVVIGALTFITFLPDSITSYFTVMPIQIFNWVSRPQEAFSYNAASGIVVMLFVLLFLNSVAIILRNKYQKRRT